MMEKAGAHGYPTAGSVPGAWWWMSPGTCSAAVTEDIECCPALLPGMLVLNTPTPRASHHPKTVPDVGGGHGGAWAGNRRLI